MKVVSQLPYETHVQTFLYNNAVLPNAEIQQYTWR